MQRINLTSLTRLLLLLFICMVAGCSTKDDNVRPVLKSYAFDSKVIEKLPIYDSLARAISEKTYVFEKYLNRNDAYPTFRYNPTSYESETFKKLPTEAGTSIDYYFTKLGNNYVYGFDFFKDNSIKIYVRAENTLGIDIEENLSYYPEGTKMKQRTYPSKDTVLNKHWQYWIRCNEEGLFGNVISF